MKIESPTHIPMPCLSSHVSVATRRTAPMPEALLARLAAIKAAHATLPRPWQLGHVITAQGLKRP